MSKGMAALERPDFARPVRVGDADLRSVCVLLLLVFWRAAAGPQLSKLPQPPGTDMLGEALGLCDEDSGRKRDGPPSLVCCWL